jgi:hypothetical protein
MIEIIKGTDCKVKFKIFDGANYSPIDLGDFAEIICAVTHNNRRLIEKRYSKNEIDIFSDTKGNKNIIVVSFKVKDTEFLKPNPSRGETARSLELFGTNGSNMVRFLEAPFYVNESGYAISRPN